MVYAGLRAAQEQYEEAVAANRPVQAAELQASVRSVLAKVGGGNGRWNGDGKQSGAMVDYSRPCPHTQEPLIHTVEYVSVARKDTMEEIEGDVAALGGAVLSLALRLGKVRLIDNVLLG